MHLELELKGVLLLHPRGLLLNPPCWIPPQAPSRAGRKGFRPLPERLTLLQGYSSTVFFSPAAAEGSYHIVKGARGTRPPGAALHSESGSCWGVGISDGESEKKSRRIRTPFKRLNGSHTGSACAPRYQGGVSTAFNVCPPPTLPLEVHVGTKSFGVGKLAANRSADSSAY